MNKVDSIMKKAKKGYKEWLVIATGDYFKKKKMKENMQEIYTGIYLKKTDKN